MPREPGSGCWLYFRGILGYWLGFCLFVMCLWVVWPELLGHTEPPWGSRDAGFYARAAAVGLLGLALIVALLGYLAIHKEERKGPPAAGKPTATGKQDDRSNWWAPAALLAMLGVGVFGTERAVAAGLNLWAAGCMAMVAVPTVLGLLFSLSERARQRRARAEPTAEAGPAYRAYLQQRKQIAQRTGMTYEKTSAMLAERFGRVEQRVRGEQRFIWDERDAPAERGTASLPRKLQHLLITRNASLTAFSVLRGEFAGVPVAVFDLELVDLDELVERGDPAGNSAQHPAPPMRHLTVWMATLPQPLPFLSSAYALELAQAAAPQVQPGADQVAESGWDSEVRVGQAAAPTRREVLSAYGETEGRHHHRSSGEHGAAPEAAARRRRVRVGAMTEQEDYARLVLSVPAVREAALATTKPPFFVARDRLVAMERWREDQDRSDRPHEHRKVLRAVDAERGMAWLAGLVHALPWPELARYRASADDEPPELGFALTYRRTGNPLTTAGGGSGPHPPTLVRVLEHWQPRQTRRGHRLFERTQLLTWQQPVEPVEPVEPDQVRRQATRAAPHRLPPLDFG